MTLPLDEALSRAERHAPFLRGLIRREEALILCIRDKGFDAAVAQAMARLDPEQASASLRTARGGVALAVALADLSGAWELEQVTAALTAFADRALDFAIAAAFAERGVEPGGLVALALGKQGSHELNFSSDLDLIFLHDPERLAVRSADATETAVRLVRRVVALLSERTSDGYAFRIDLRLRPDPDSTPASLPVGAAEGYYQSEALAWERSAFIRARPAAGDLALGRAFLTVIRPFLWRRNLDYSALADIRDVTFRIRDHFEDRQAPGPGWDVKRGRGGIREIEFYAQAHQMIWGGRDERLRAPATLDALSVLAEAGHVSPADARVLSDSYRLFRRVEHRLQMVEDQQTHLVPRQKPAREGVAALDGAPDWKTLENELVRGSRDVARLYDRLIAIGDDEGGPRGPRIPHAPDDVGRWAAQMRLQDPALAASLLSSWRRGHARSLRAPESRRAFEVVLPGLLASLGRGPGGREAMLRLDRMIAALPYGVQVWRLLKAHPELAETLARLLTATPWLADSLATRPQLLDVLLSPPPPLETIEAALAELRDAVRGLGEEAVLDRVRVWTHERQFHAAMTLLEGAITPLEAARLLARLAEATVLVLAEQVEAGFAARHGSVPGSELLVLALGRFGGGELTFQSDLDLVFLFTGDWRENSDGPEPVTASARWNRFATRLVAALSVPTAAGRLHEVDTRLRPSGRDGLLAVSLDSFATYQMRDAEPWETMALTRARPITGSNAARAAASRAIAAIVRGPHDGPRVLQEAQSIRAYMATHKPPSGTMDLKLGRGGLVDLEFIVQTRALLSGQPVPTDLAGAADVVAPELVGAAELLSAALVVMRLVAPAGSERGPDREAMRLMARLCGKAGAGELKAAIAEARIAVNGAWRDTFGKARKGP